LCSFKRFDVNSNGVLSLAEVDKAVRDVLGLDSLYSAKPALMRAFQAAKDANKEKAKKRPTRAGLSRDDYVERDEFRLLLVYLRQYFEYFVAFNRMDVNPDHRLTLEEFRLAVTNGTLSKLGINVKEEEVDTVFASIDSNDGDFVLFDEFCHWAIEQNLDVDDDDDYDPEEKIGFKSAEAGAGHKQPKGAPTKSPTKAAVDPPPMPAWKRKLADQRQAASTASANIIAAASAKEQAAAERLAQLKARANREFTRAASLARIEEHRERKRLLAEEAKAEYDKLSGREMIARVAFAEELSEEDVVSLSKKFNDALKGRDPDLRNFFTLFKSMDMDGSRRISFNELDVLVRHQLGLKEKHLSQTQLLALWKKLDENASGFIDAGELSRFLRIGQSNELTPAQRARKKLQQARLAEKERLREESRKRLERNVADKSQTVEKATEEEMARFAKIFNEKLKGSDITNFFALFKWMDMDASGKVKFDEFDSMVRKALKVAHSEVSNANLFSLWAAIDENQNGFISSGEFVHFMRSASAQIDESERLDRNVAAESTQRLAEQATLAQIGKEETWARVRATQAVQKAKAMEAEIERIERLMADFEALRKKSDKLHAKVSSGKQSRFQTPGHLPEVGAVPQEEEPPADAGDDASVPSPGGQSTMTSTLGSTNGKRKERVTASSIRAEALHMLAREVNMPGMLPKRSPSMLLPTLQREEGGL